MKNKTNFALKTMENSYKQPNINNNECERRSQDTNELETLSQ